MDQMSRSENEIRNISEVLDSVTARIRSLEELIKQDTDDAIDDCMDDHVCECEHDVAAISAANELADHFRTPGAHERCGDHCLELEEFARAYGINRLEVKL